MTNLVFILVAFIFLIGFGVVTYLYYQERVLKIDPANCPQILASYAVIPAQFSPPLINPNCPNGTCQFTVDDLTGAITQCNSQPNLCSGFVLTTDTDSNNMWYIDPGASRETQGDANIYLRQSDFLTLT